MQIRQTTFSSNDELQELVDLQNIVYQHRGLQFSVDGFKYWYKENPVGEVVSYSAFEHNKMVSHYACIPTQMKIEDRVVKGVLSMAVVTHPDYRGRGLFRTLAQKTYEKAKELGYEFVIGVANANSFPIFMRHFPFNYIGQLDVKWGWGKIKIPNKMFSHYWTDKTIQWRTNKPKYSKYKNNIFGLYGKLPFIKTFMGEISEQFSNGLNLKLTNHFIRPFNLYVGMGADFSYGHYFDVPKFVKHSPFHLRFMDITPDKHLPMVTKENIVFQLIDFDVA